MGLVFSPSLLFANFGLGVLGNYQQTEYKQGSQSFSKLGGGLSMSWESVKDGFYLGATIPLIVNTTQKGTVSGAELSGFSQMEFAGGMLVDFNYRISRVGFFAGPGYMIKYALAGTQNGSEVKGSGRFGTGFVVGGGIKVYATDSVFLKAAGYYEFLEYGADLGASGTSRDFKSGMYGQFTVGYIFGATDAAKDPYAAPAPAATDPYAAPAEEPKPAAGKKPAAKKKGK